MECSNTKEVDVVIKIVLNYLLSPIFYIILILFIFKVKI